MGPTILTAMFPAKRETRPSGGTQSVSWSLRLETPHPPPFPLLRHALEYVSPRQRRQHGSWQIAEGEAAPQQGWWAFLTQKAVFADRTS